MLAGSAGDAKSEEDFWKMVLNEPENHKPGLGEFFFIASRLHSLPVQKGRPCIPIDFFFNFVITLWIFFPSKT